MDEALAQRRPLAPLAVLKALVLVFILAKIVVLFSASVFQDEAYYWLWGQHPALSYYDHPPLNAWLQGLMGAIFGWNKFAMRLMVGVSFAADIGFLWLISKLVARDWPEHFWLTLLLFLSTPLFFAATALALPDHLLTTLMLGSLYFLLSFLQNWPDQPRWGHLFLGAACLGLGGLAKFNAAFLGIGLGLYILYTPRLRPLLAKPQLYLAAVIAIAPQIVVVLWNLDRDMASYRFILSRRYGSLVPGLKYPVRWLINFLLVVGPFLVLPLVMFGLRARVAGSGLSRLVFWLSTISIFALSVVTDTRFHWNIMAYIVALPFLAFYLRWRWMTWAHLAYGGVVIAALLVNFSWGPVGNVKARDDDATGWAYGWDDVAAAVREAEAKYATDFVVSSDYANTSLLAFALQDKDVAGFSGRIDQFDFWFDPAAHAGQDAILVGDIWEPFTDDMKARFSEVVLLTEVPIVRGGQEIDRHQIYLGRGFIAAPQ